MSSFHPASHFYRLAYLVRLNDFLVVAMSFVSLIYAFNQPVGVNNLASEHPALIKKH